MKLNKDDVKSLLMVIFVSILIISVSFFFLYIEPKRYSKYVNEEMFNDLVVDTNKSIVLIEYKSGAYSSMEYITKIKVMLSNNYYLIDYSNSSFIFKKELKYGR